MGVGNQFHQAWLRKRFQHVWFHNVAELRQLRADAAKQTAVAAKQQDSPVSALFNSSTSLAANMYQHRPNAQKAEQAAQAARARQEREPHRADPPGLVPRGLTPTGLGRGATPTRARYPQARLPMLLPESQPAMHHQVRSDTTMCLSLLLAHKLRQCAVLWVCVLFDGAFQCAYKARCGHLGLDHCPISLLHAFLLAVHFQGTCMLLS